MIRYKEAPKRRECHKAIDLNLTANNSKDSNNPFKSCTRPSAHSSNKSLTFNNNLDPSNPTTRNRSTNWSTVTSPWLWSVKCMRTRRKGSRGKMKGWLTCWGWRKRKRRQATGGMAMWVGAVIRWGNSRSYSIITAGKGRIQLITAACSSSQQCSLSLKPNPFYTNRNTPDCPCL